MARQTYLFTECQTEISIGEKTYDSVRELAKDSEWAWRDNMDTFSATHMSGVTRVTEEESGRVVGWINTETGKFVTR